MKFKAMGQYFFGISKLGLISLLLILMTSYYLHEKYSNGEISITNELEKTYDYIIVGAGTAGCVLAARLSEDPNMKVLLVEAGDRINFLAKIPILPTIVQRGRYDWSYTTTPQKFSSFGMFNQMQRIPRGRGLGGSGQINYMMHGFGLPKDFDNWQVLGAHGWSYNDLKPYFIKVFGTDRSEFDSVNSCPVEGYCPALTAPMRLKMQDGSNELMKVFREASSSFNKSGNIMFKIPTSTLLNGVRTSSYEAYLKKVLNRTNLHVSLNTQGVMIGFTGTRASSLYILKKKTILDNVFAKKEIILCAGTINTPQILMLSGIGPDDQLAQKNIRAVKILNNVGKNLHDQINMPLYVSIKRPISITLEKLFTVKEMWNFLWNRSGPFAFPPISGTEITSEQSALILFTLGSANERILRELSNYRPEPFYSMFPYHNNTGKEGFIFLATCLQPESRGTVTLGGDKIRNPPLINPNYFSTKGDIHCIIKAIRRAIKLVNSKPFKDIGAKLHWPHFEQCKPLWTKSVRDEYLECILRQVAVTSQHVGGTCSMGGPDPVVDSSLRVNGIGGLRIIDASILPTPVSLYPNSVLIAMSEKAVDIIKSQNEAEET